MAKIPTKKKALIAQRRDEVTKYALAGFSLRQIAKKLGCSRQTAKNDFDKRIAEAAKNDPSAAQYRQIVVGRYNNLIATQMQAALSGDREAIKCVREITQELCKIFGLYAPKEIDVNAIVTGAPPVINVVFDENPPINGETVPENTPSEAEKGALPDATEKDRG